MFPSLPIEDKYIHRPGMAAARLYPHSKVGGMMAELNKHVTQMIVMTPALQDKGEEIN